MRCALARSNGRCSSYRFLLVLRRIVAESLAADLWGLRDLAPADGARAGRAHFRLVRPSSLCGRACAVVVVAF
eukprot:11198952-Lingulodinium_polyedra.AAC.1